MASPDFAEIRDLPSGEKIRVMIVEDQHLIRRPSGRCCRWRTGIEIVAEAGDGQEGKAPRQARPDVVLMDLQMPNLSAASP